MAARLRRWKVSLGPKVSSIIAQGNALGSRSTLIQGLKARPIAGRPFPQNSSYAICCGVTPRLASSLVEALIIIGGPQR